MPHYPDYVKIFSIIAHDRKLFFACGVDNEVAIHIVEAYAKKTRNKSPIVQSYGYMVNNGASVRFLHPHEDGVRCESESILWDYYNGSIPESVYVFSNEVGRSKNEAFWKHYGTPNEVEISSTLDSVGYTSSGRYSSIESACA